MTIDSPTKGADKSAPDEVRGGAFWPMMALVVAAAAVLLMLQVRRPKPPDPYAGMPLPPLAVGGWLNAEKPLTAKDLQGQVVLVDFWATWCGPCVRGIPELIRFRKRYREQGVLVVGLTSEDGAAVEHVKNFVETKDGMDWPIGYGAGMTFKMMGVQGIPLYLLYDRTGKSVWGGHSLRGLDEAVVAALAKSESG